MSYLQVYMHAYVHAYIMHACLSQCNPVLNLEETEAWAWFPAWVAHNQPSGLRGYCVHIVHIQTDRQKSHTHKVKLNKSF